MLGDLGRQVAGQLQATPRGSVAGIAASLGQPEHVVRAVFDRLTRSGALKVSAIVDPSAFGRPLVVGFRLEVEGDRDSVVRSLQDRPEVHWLTVVDDARTILATANFADAQEVNTYAENVIRAIPGVGECSMLVYLEFEPIAYFGDSTARRRILPSLDRSRAANLDELDLRLLTEFLRDARISYAKAGKNVGLSLSATRQRVMRLEESGTLRFHVLPNPFVLELYAAAMVCMRTTGSHNVIKEALLELPGTTNLAETTGEYGLVVEFFAEERASLDAHVQSILRIPGVRDIRMDIYRDVVRDTGTWSPWL